jgi:RNA polymerase sigma-70 factor (ECF subfamily)
MDIEHLYERYGPMVMRRCRQLLRDEEAAFDAMQDVFVHVLRHRNRLTADYPSSLLYRMATNLCLNRIRDGRHEREGRQPLEDHAGRLVAAIAHADEVESRSLLGRLFDRHAESTRTMAVLHYVDGLTLAETAREVGLSVSGVRKRLAGLRQTLTELTGQ